MTDGTVGSMPGHSAWIVAAWNEIAPCVRLVSGNAPVIILLAHRTARFHLPVALGRSKVPSQTKENWHEDPEPWCTTPQIE